MMSYNLKSNDHRSSESVEGTNLIWQGVYWLETSLKSREFFLKKNFRPVNATDFVKFLPYSWRFFFFFSDECDHILRKVCASQSETRKVPATRFKDNRHSDHDRRKLRYESRKGLLRDRALN